MSDLKCGTIVKSAKWNGTVEIYQPNVICVIPKTYYILSLIKSKASRIFNEFWRKRNEICMQKLWF